MKNSLSAIFGSLLCLLVLSCGSDDTELEPTIRNIDGVVTGTVFCNIDGKSLIGIESENFELPSELIITGTLPEELNRKGYE